MTPIQALVVIFGIFALIKTLSKFRKRKITRKEAVFWSIVWISLAMFSILPGIASFFADLLDIGRGVDVILYASVIILFYIVFLLYSKLEKTNREVTKLVRKLAIEKGNKKQKQ